MPELPEVETIVRGLAGVIPGRTVQAVEVYRPDLIVGEAAYAFAAGLRGRSVLGVRRRAKNIVIELEDQVLAVNLGMTGRLLARRDAGAQPPYLGARFLLSGDTEMLYVDVRRFGRLQRFAPDAWRAREAELGLEPLSSTLTPRRLLELASRSRVALKTWLMDQRHVVGIGNIYASEALFRARLDPRRAASSLTLPVSRRLHRAIREVLMEAIDFRGTTLLDYRDADGGSGGFAERLRVYDREGEPCPRCGRPIARIVQGGRSTFFCPRCQR